MKIEYQVLTGDSLLNLERLVNDALYHGWRLQGGIAAKYSELTGSQYLQAMTREIK